MRVRSLLFRRRCVGMLLVACTVGAVRSSHAQAPAWVHLSPPAEVTLHVRDSRRDREIFFDQSGLVAVDDLAATRWSRIFFGPNPVLVRGSGFAFYDFARDRIWAMTLPISDSLKLWTMDLADVAPAWTAQAYTWSNPALSDTVIMDSGLLFDDARDRLLSFGGFDLAGVLPNPSNGPLSVKFSLPGSAPATLELFDVTGRRLAERAVGGLGAGTHQLRLDSDRVRLAAGLYLVRLRQSGSERVARVVIAP